MVVNTGEDEDQIMEEEMPSAQPQATPKDEQAIPPSQNVQASQELSQTQQRIAQDIPRLMITKIENHNFKSYAGTQVLGPFHKSFSSIVGPNGSGKSNVIDAMLFVFGYRSKKIRSKKLSLLIHNSENHQNLDSCTVTVHFQKIIDREGDDFDVVPNSNFTVSRTARKDGSSDYYMNGKKQTFKEVGIVLRTCGIDLDHNRFLILQGEVEQISMMKPKAETEHDEGMLEYLEDIIGSSRFKEPIENVAKEVEELNERRGEKLNRVKAVEKEKDELEGSKNEAMEFLTMENDITKKKHICYQTYVHECAVNEEKAKEKKDEIQKQLDELQTQLKEFIDQKKEKGKNHKQITKLFDKLVAEAEEKKKAFAEFEKYDLKLREDLKHRRQNKKKFEKNLEAERKKLVELQAVPSKSTEEIEKYTNSLVELDKQKVIEEKKLDEIMAGLKHETEGLQKEKEVKQNELMGKQKVVNESKSKYDVAKSELEIYLSQHKSLQKQHEDAKNNAEKAKNVREERIRQVASFKEDLPSLKKDLEKAEKNLQKVTKEEADLAAKIKVNRNKIAESRSAMEASRSRGAVIDALMNEKKRGNLPGIYGRLGDLGGIDMKYDVAVSTACGPLDFMVCDTMETAQKGVQFLKRANAGSTTFIALDKVESWRQKASSRIDTPGGTERLFDLIKVQDEKLKTAFYFALKDTLVADNLEVATRIAYPKDPKARRWRVVTLKGELIETSGTMSGGGTKVAKGRMGCKAVTEEKVDPRMLENLEKSVEEDIETLQELREKKSELEMEVQKLTKQLKTTDHQLQKSQMEIESLTAQEKEQNERVKELNVQVKAATPDPDRVKKFEKDVTEFQKTLKKASDAAEIIEKEVTKLHNKIMEIGKSKLGGQQEKVNSVNKIIDEVTQKKTKATVAAKTAGRNIKKSEEKVASVEKELEENESEMQSMQAEFSKLEEDATRVLQEHQSAQDQMKEMEAELNVVRAAYATTEKEEGEFKSKEIDIKHELSKFDTVVKENHGKLKHWQKEMDKLLLHNVDKPLLGEADKASDKLPMLSTDELKELDKEAVMYEVTVLEERLAAMKPNMAAIAEYFKKEEAYLSRVKELDEVTEERDTKRKELDSLRKQRLDEFMSGFSIITTKLKEMYQMITLGGDAELELVDSLDPFSEGIVFSVRPPKKSWKNISNLSGGEKTLSSLALVFALHHFKPTPLYVMDEIDAALDFKNVSIVANYIKERTRNAQFIIISLRNNMFELADRLVGIYKTDNCTKSVVINPHLIESDMQMAER